MLQDGEVEEGVEKFAKDRMWRCANVVATSIFWGLYSKVTIGAS
jgi:hypothetical protein